MNVQENTIFRMRHVRFAALFPGVVAAVLPCGAIAKDARVCTAGTTLRLSAPEASQGSLLLIELKSTKPMAEVQGEWGGRAVPLWREDGDEAQRKGGGQERLVCDREIASWERVRQAQPGTNPARQ